jgi:hypothetical protein
MEQLAKQSEVSESWNAMKERLLSNWTFIRVMYLLVGVSLVIQGLAGQQWLISLWGAYFASMGLFGFGCASGGCYTYNRPMEPGTDSRGRVSDPEFEEIKSAKNG